MALTKNELIAKIMEEMDRNRKAATESVFAVRIKSTAGLP
jgi:hypothetical protein